MNRTWWTLLVDVNDVFHQSGLEAHRSHVCPNHFVSTGWGMNRPRRPQWYLLCGQVWVGEACSCQARKRLSSAIGSFPEVFSSLSLQTISTLLLKITPQGLMSKWSKKGQRGSSVADRFQYKVCFSTQHFHSQKFQLETPALMS